jgi:hypothetical protein
LPEVLRNADHLDTALGQSVYGVQEQARISGESRLAIDQHDIDWAFGARRFGYHPIKFGTPRKCPA